jgi:hypothetical protein
MNSIGYVTIENGEMERLSERLFLFKVFPQAVYKQGRGGIMSRGSAAWPAVLVGRFFPFLRISYS